MSKVDPSANRSSFFPHTRNGGDKVNGKKVNSPYLQRNSSSRKTELEKTTKKHAKVDIPNAVRDFAKIKSAVDKAPEVDNSEKIARLKEQINAGTYNINYDGLADKILSSEF